VIELAAYGEAAELVLATFPGARRDEVEAGWEERWREFHRPVEIGPLWIGPPWEAAPPDRLAVVIDPGRAFGTGAHPTTRLSLELLQEIEPGSLLDIGCGSGVLSIAAALLGFAPVTGVDIEQAAVDATLENAHANGVEVQAWRVDQQAELPTAQIAVANISLDGIRAVASRLDVAQLITSGYLADTGTALDGYRHVTRRGADGWAADLYLRA
jgi:ribosomal protein L11 methyltransferase